MPGPLDPFALLGLPATFDLDAGDVERAYLQRAAAVHPDVASDSEEAGEVSGTLNSARQTLLDPESRANVLLALRGGPSKEDNKSLPAGFLMEIMETRERVDQALASRDASSLRAWRQWALDQRAAYVARVGALFRGASPDTLAEVRTTLNAWRYVERLIEQLGSA